MRNISALQGPMPRAGKSICMTSSLERASMPLRLRVPASMRAAISRIESALLRESPALRKSPSLMASTFFGVGCLRGKREANFIYIEAAALVETCCPTMILHRPAKRSLCRTSDCHCVPRIALYRIGSAFLKCAITWSMGNSIPFLEEY